MVKQARAASPQDASRVCSASIRHRSPQIRTPASELGQPVGWGVSFQSLGWVE